MRLFGANPSFIRRPLIYRGVLLGFSGGLLAWLIVTLMLSWLSEPLSNLVTSYKAQLTINTINFHYCFLVCLYAMVLAGLGAWFAVTPYLKKELD